MQRIPEPELMDIPERAEAYARTDFSEVNAAFVARVLYLAGDAPTLRAVDLGTGPGDVPLRIAALRPAWKIAAVDASLPMLRHAAASRGADTRNVMFLLADAKRLPWADAQFGLIYSSSLLHHLLDPAPFWREIRRIARPDAVVVVRDLMRPDSRDEAQRLVDTYAPDAHPLLRDDFFNSFLAAFTPEEIRAQLCAAGLADLRVERITDRHVDVFGKVGLLRDG